MSTLQYYRLALLELLRYNQALEEVLTLRTEIGELQGRVAAHQKKHRRCDREIAKMEQCPLCEKRYGSEVAVKLHIKLKHGGGREEEQSSAGEGEGGEDKENRRDN